MTTKSFKNVYEEALAREPKEDALLKDNESGMYCRACRQADMWHCSDPENCGGMERMRNPALKETND